MEKKELETSIDIAQQHLEEDLGQLKEIVKEKLDVKKHAREAVDDALLWVRTTLQRRPGISVGIAAALGIVVALIPMLRDRMSARSGELGLGRDVSVGGVL
jgi:ElaB/YqjD/DUF883 family membrane-anchored ribosome-binding protein